MPPDAALAEIAPAALVPGRSSGSSGAALSRPVTPRMLPASEEGTESGPSLARSG